MVWFRRHRTEVYKYFKVEIVLIKATQTHCFKIFIYNQSVVPEKQKHFCTI